MQGLLTVVIRDKKTRTIISSFSKKNVIVYQSGDILAKLLDGNVSYKPTHIFGEHVPGGTYTDGVLPSGLTASITDTIDDLSDSGTDRKTDNSQEPIAGTSFSHTSEFPIGTPINYWSHNHITYQAIIGDPLVDTRQFVGAGLVSVVDSNNYLFAHQYHKCLTKQSSFEIVYIWTIKLT